MKISDIQKGPLDELIRIGADIVGRQMTKASAGNLSMLDPENREAMIVTGAGTWLNRLDNKSFVKMTLDGEIIDGDMEPSTEWRMHAGIYKQRPDAHFVVHAHPKHSVLLDALGKEIRFFTLDHISYVRSYGTSPFAPNASNDLASAVSKQFEKNDVVIMSHHGVVTCGETATWAYRKMLNMEDSAEMTYRAILLGDESSRFPKDQILSVHN